jgi:hypothetical protein
MSAEMQTGIPSMERVDKRRNDDIVLVNGKNLSGKNIALDILVSDFARSAKNLIEKDEITRN